jgi:hypothetical protein
MERKRFRIASEKESFSAVCFCAHTPAGPCWGHTSSFPAVLCGSRLSTSHLDHASHTPVLTLPPQRLYANGSVDDSPRGACGALLPVQQTGDSRQGRECHPSRGGRGVKHVRQTLSDVGARIGAVKRDFPDRACVRECPRLAAVPAPSGSPPQWRAARCSAAQLQPGQAAEDRLGLRLKGSLGARATRRLVGVGGQLQLCSRRGD